MKKLLYVSLFFYFNCYSVKSDGICHLQKLPPEIKKKILFYTSRDKEIEQIPDSRLAREKKDYKPLGTLTYSQNKKWTIRLIMHPSLIFCQGPYGYKYSWQISDVDSKAEEKIITIPFHFNYNISNHAISNDGNKIAICGFELTDTYIGFIQHNGYNIYIFDIRKTNLTL